MLISRSLQSNHDESALAIDIRERHPEDAMSTCAGTPVSDPLSGAAEQCENRFIPKGGRSINELLYIRRFQALGHLIWHSASKPVALPGTRWQVTACHPMAQLLIEQLPRRRVHTATPWSAAILGIAADMKVKV
jgi:hypothetical protein